MAERTVATHEIRQALVNPSSVFHRPSEVVGAAGVSTRQKIEILRRWEYDVREEEVAQEENMTGDLPVTLSQVLDALNALDAPLANHHTSPTKQGGL